MANVGLNIKTKYDDRGVKQARSGLGDLANVGLGGIAGGLGIGLGVKELLDFGVASFKAAEEGRVAAVAFENLSGSASSAHANLLAMERATRGLIGSTEQMQIASQLLGMNIVQTSDQLEEVVGVSRRLGKTFKGLGAQEAAEEFAIMIANMSEARLDSFGLSSERVSKRVKELMETVEGMTKEQAFFQATMEEGRKTIERLGPEVETTSDQVAKLGVEWGNFQAFLGKTIEESGAVQGFFKELTQDFILLRQAMGDDTPETRIKALNVEIERQTELLEVFTSRGLGDIGRSESLNALQAELDGLLETQKELEEQGKAEQEQQQAAIRSEEIAAENAAKREESAKKLAETQKDFARDVINIQQETDEELLNLQERFVDDSLDAEEKHADNILDIRKKAAKDQERAAKRLQKDLAKVDTNLKEDLVKQQIDEDKEIAKLRSRAGDEEKQTRRRSQIDATADERLFQFELRQLAAEGQGNAIKEALERREIEQQIASEKAEFEKTVEKDKREDQVRSIREEGAERRAQLQEQAAERKADLEERNREAAESRAERIAEELADEAEAFANRQEELKEFLSEQTEETREGERDRVEAIAKGLAEVEELTNTQLDQMIALAAEFGPEFGETFADGMTKAFEENLKIESAIEGAAESTIGAGTGPLPIAQGSNQPSRGGIPVFQEGGEVTRSGLAFVDQGERIIPAGGTGGVTVNINSPVFGVDDLDNKLNVWGQQIVDAIGENMN